MGMIAAGMGCSRSYVSYLLSGKRRGSVDMLQALAGFLGCSLEHLIGVRHKVMATPTKRLLHPPVPIPRKKAQASKPAPPVSKLQAWREKRAPAR